jgi:hypothetical protein
MVQQACTLYDLCLHIFSEVQDSQKILIFGIEELEPSIFETFDLSRFCDAFVGERVILKLRKKDVLSPKRREKMRR